MGYLFSVESSPGLGVEFGGDGWGVSVGAEGSLGASGEDGTAIGTP